MATIIANKKTHNITANTNITANNSQEENTNLNNNEDHPHELDQCADEAQDALSGVT